MIKEDYIESFDKTQIFIKKNLVENPIASLVIIHGFAEHLGRYDYVANKLCELGFNVYRFDNRGHGRTKSKRGHIDNFNDYIKDTDIVIDLVRNENDKLNIFILGHSMGGFIASLYGIVYGNKINGQILSGAATQTPEGINKFKSMSLKVLNKIVPKLRIKINLSSYICTDKKVIDDYVNDKYNLKNASVRLYYQFVHEGINWLNQNLEKYNCPCLILHGKEDKIISYKASEMFYEKISSIDKEIVIYDSLYHEILNESIKDNIIITISKWIKERII